jgi:hypothetical protein
MGGKSKDTFQAAVPGDSFTIFKVQACSLKMEPIGCPETSVTNYQSTLLDIAEDQTSFTLSRKLEFSYCTAFI